jgi:hypothetical protein
MSPRTRALSIPEWFGRQMGNAPRPFIASKSLCWTGAGVGFVNVS